MRRRAARGEALVCGAGAAQLARMLERGRAPRRACGGTASSGRPGRAAARQPPNFSRCSRRRRLGAIAVPLSTREQTPGLAYMLGNSGAKLLVHDAESPPRAAAAATPALARRVAVEPGAPYSALPLLASVPVAAGGGDEEDDRDHPLHLGHHRAAEGRDADPSRHRALGDALRVLHGARRRATARVVAVPLSHVTGLVALIAAMVRCAGTLIVMPAFKAARVPALAARERMTHTLMVPAMYNLCLLRAGLRAPRPVGLARRRLWRRADADRDHRRASPRSCPA